MIRKIRACCLGDYDCTTKRKYMTTFTVKDYVPIVGEDVSITQMPGCIYSEVIKLELDISDRDKGNDYDFYQVVVFDTDSDEYWTEYIAVEKEVIE